MAKHVMIDIETLGLTNDAVIACIAAVPFNPVSGHIGEGAEWLLSVDDSAKLGFKMDCKTVAFWDGLPDEAQYQLRGETLVRSQILSFMDWMKKFAAGDEVMVWAKPPAFDLALLKSHFERLGYFDELPWSYRNERCVKSVVEDAVELGMVSQVSFCGEPHIAVFDARYQAACVIEAKQFLSSLRKQEAA